MLTRRSALIGASALAACATEPAALEFDRDPRIAAIEARIGGRIGFVAMNTANGAFIGHRGDERFAMCSMFKWVLACATLERLPADRMIAFTQADILEPATGTRPHLAAGAMRVDALAEAGILYSDNTAANLLLRELGGPRALTAFAQENASDARFDRYEPDLNENAPGDPRDTTTPGGMVRLLRRLLVDKNNVRTETQENVISWMIATETGRARLRAGLPANWRAGDKTGTSLGDHNAVTDALIAWPPGRAPIVMACFISGSLVELPAQNAAHAEIARLVAQTWT